MRKLLLTDVDGVVLNWSDHFNKYLKQYHPQVSLMNPTTFSQTEDIGKLIQGFNQTAWIGFLEPLRDAHQVLPKFKEQGWTIIACTSMGTDQYANSLRKQNLERVFPNIFDRIDIIPFMSPKNEWLSQYKDSDAVWVEDKWANALAGANQRLNTYLMRHEYNASNDDKRITKVDNWQQIASKVL
ncbi:MAG: hypothetical protein CBC05_02375 [Crocinitomicaceae bacterium TMED45]|nr:MAG: hypothetical protein CBC05_02375 [Crocinitomicaceae bacterium TMED45]|tara:strand:+ start:35520 stop:36071 length:552 start_codon:yes stop_codon:yes gene_type:complete